jgi:hypothetical protein
MKCAKRTVGTLVLALALGGHAYGQALEGDGGFEYPITSTYVYDPAVGGFAWNYDPASGIQHNGSDPPPSLVRV